MKWYGFHEKKTIWVAARDMVSAKEVVECFEENKAKGSNEKNVGIDKDINLLYLAWTQCTPQHVLVL